MATKVLSVSEIQAIQAAKKQLGLTPAGTFTKMPESMGTKPKEPTFTQILKNGPRHQTPSQRRWEIDKMLEEHNLHPIEEMIKMAACNEHNGQTLSCDQKIKLLDLLASYTTPKLKSMEVSGQVDHSITVNILKFEDVVAAAKPIVEVANG